MFHLGQLGARELQRRLARPAGELLRLPGLVEVALRPEGLAIHVRVAHVLGGRRPQVQHL